VIGPLGRVLSKSKTTVRAAVLHSLTVAVGSPHAALARVAVSQGTKHGDRCLRNPCNCHLLIGG
jgi:hypothetical protein